MYTFNQIPHPPVPAIPAAISAPPGRRQRIGTPEIVRAITKRWISLVPSKIV